MAVRPCYEPDTWTNDGAGNWPFHGAIAIFLGLLAGFPFAFVILDQMAGDVRAWEAAILWRPGGT